MARLYGPREWCERGAIVAFNVLDARGGVVPFAKVEQAAREARVSIRGGCFCNPGAAEACGLGFGARDEGAVRASFGAASDGRDVERLLRVVVDVAQTSTERAASRGAASAASPLTRGVRAAGTGAL
jgi:selenocysteine lyase/cysteine desulfurase